MAQSITQLENARCISLTTFRKDGRGIATPIWFAVDGDHLVAFTGAQTGKAKRIRRNPLVTIAACTYRGRVKGPALQATARILPDSERERVMGLIRRKYVITKWLLDAVVGIIRLVARSPQPHSVYIELTLDEGSATP